MKRSVLALHIVALGVLTACGVREVHLATPMMRPEIIGASPACSLTLKPILDQRTQKDPSGALSRLNYKVDDLPALLVYDLTEWFGSHGIQLVSAREAVDAATALELSILKFYLELHPSTMTTTIVLKASSVRLWGPVELVLRGNHTRIIWVGSDAEFRRAFRDAVQDAGEELWSKLPVQFTEQCDRTS